MMLEEEYEAVFNALKADFGKRAGTRNSWIGYLFHFTNITNAAAILESGRLLCRNLALSNRVMHHDNAAAGIIRHTNQDIGNHVRLYFRPRNPTFFHNEGFKSRAQLLADSYSAHCPVPVAFVFKAARVLALSGVRFSDGNLGTKSYQSVLNRTMSGPGDLASLPFDSIYHSESLNVEDPRKAAIIRHRNAEVIVPQVLNLQSNLVAIRCRSDAELETLRTLLAADVWHQYRPLSAVNNDGTLFFATRYFIEKVWITDDIINLKVHPTGVDDSFSARLSIEYENADIPPLKSIFKLRLNWSSPVKIRIRSLNENQGPIVISIFLDNHLAYMGRHWPNSETIMTPFGDRISTD